MKTDIRYRGDIDFLIRHFYLKLSNDVLLKTYFSGFDAEKKSDLSKELLISGRILYCLLVITMGILWKFIQCCIRNSQ